MSGNDESKQETLARMGAMFRDAEKAMQDGGGTLMTIQPIERPRCLMTNCNRIAPSGEAFCKKHRERSK